jgi:iron complex outermembrane receptor protein
VPEHYGQVFATVRRGVVWSGLEVTASSEASANDAGTVNGAGFAAWNWRAGVDAATVGGLRVQPTVSIENMFDRRYASSLVINATRNRFFEPGLPRRISFLMSLQWR